jgi:tetratricopeptide (TPR) repeat protein
MSALCDDLPRFLDEELDDDHAAIFRRHLGVCHACPSRLAQAFLTDVMTHEALSTPVVLSKPVALAAARATERSTDVLAALRHRRRNMLLAFGGLAAAALALLVPGWLDRGPASPALALDTPYRSIEGQLGYAGLEGHRPLVRERGGAIASARGARREQTLARLEQAGDHHGLAVAALIEGRLDEAARQFEQARPSAVVLADRAALALARNDPRRALILSEQALAESPRLPAAMWNRAMALERLARHGDAVGAFRAVAALEQPGWSEEARRRAAGSPGVPAAGRDPGVGTRTDHR